MSLFADTLRQARAEKGVTLRQAEQATRINRHYLAALEDNQFENLPSLIYQRGIVRSYATYLGLDQARLLEMFEEARGYHPEDPPVVTPHVRPDMPSHWSPNFAIITFMLVSGAVIFAWLYSAYFAGSNVTPTPANFLPTVTPVSRDALFMPSPTSFAIALATETPVPVPTIPPPPTVDASQSIASTGAEPTAPSVEEAPASAPANTSDEAPVIPADQRGKIAAIQITALSGIQVQVTCDGIETFSGWLEAGQSTPWSTCAAFTVYTSNGASTQFTNDRLEDFFMGDEQGEAVYDLYAAAP